MKILINMSLALFGALTLSSVGHSESFHKEKTELHCSHNDVVSIDSLVINSFELSIEKTETVAFTSFEEVAGDNPKAPNEADIVTGIIILEKHNVYPDINSDAFKLYKQPIISDRFRIRNKSNI